VAWEIWPRDADLGRTLDPISVWSELRVVERYVSNGPPTWTLTGPSEQLGVFTPSTGCILDEDGMFAVSGQVRSISRSYAANPDTGRFEDTMTLGFVGDADEPWSRLIWPEADHPLTTTTSNFTAAYDTRTGARETILLAYIAASLGPAAPISSRRMAGLLLPSTLGRGGSTTFQARMNVLGDVVAELAEAGGLDVRIEHDESTGTPRLAVVVDEVSDVSDDIVFGSADSARASGIVSAWSYSMDAPEVTDAIVFAAGELEAREAARFTDEAAVSLWGRRRERLVDQRPTDDASVMADAGTKALEDGASPVSVSIALADGGDAIYRDTYRLGDRVGVELPGLPLAISDNRVREVVTVVQQNQPQQRTITIGSPGATSIQPPSAARLTKALRHIAAIERNA
jgi:hypothetical protein